MDFEKKRGIWPKVKSKWFCFRGWHQPAKPVAELNCGRMFGYAGAGKVDEFEAKAWCMILKCRYCNKILEFETVELVSLCDPVHTDITFNPDEMDFKNSKFQKDW